MNEIYYKIIFAFLWLTYTGIRVPHAKRNKQNKTVQSEGKQREKFLVFLATAGMMIIPFIWVFSNLFSKFDIHFSIWLRLLGIIIGVFSLWLFYIVHKILGRNWSPILEIRQGHTLIKDGPYKRIRHPMYTQVWLWVIAQFLICSNWIPGLAGIISWSILYFIRVPREEKLMEQQFGREYIQYKKETGRIIPKF